MPSNSVKPRAPSRRMQDKTGMQDGIERCWWCGTDPLYTAYHDHEWGRPVHDDRRLFEKVCLEGFQAGLSWITILRKRGNFRRAFHDFDFNVVSRFGARDVTRLLKDEGTSGIAGRLNRSSTHRRLRVPVARYRSAICKD